MTHTSVNYWNTLLVNIEKIKEEWEQGKNYSNRLKLFLIGNDPDKKKKYVDFIFPSNNIQKENIDNNYETILKKPNAVYLQGLREFLVGKNYVVEEYVANNSASFTNTEKKNLLLALTKMFSSDSDLLIQILLMKIWNSKSVDEVFLYTPVISDEKINQFIESMDKVVAAIKRKNKGKYEYKGVNAFKNNHVFWFEKQSSDKMLRAFSKNIRFKPSYDILFNINTKDHLIEIKCSNKSLLDNLASIIARNLSINLVYYYKDNEAHGSVEKVPEFSRLCY